LQWLQVAGMCAISCCTLVQHTSYLAYVVMCFTPERQGNAVHDPIVYAIPKSYANSNVLVCRFIASAYDKPQYRLHFRSDAPIELKCLFYVPRFHSEKFGMGRVEPGVNLYSRKVLIEAKPADLLPGWLRCVASPLMVAVTTLCGY
jgi:hypothetical protein